MSPEEMNKEKKQIFIGCGTIILLTFVFIGIGIAIHKFFF